MTDTHRYVDALLYEVDAPVDAAVLLAGVTEEQGQARVLLEGEEGCRLARHGLPVGRRAERSAGRWSYSNSAASSNGMSICAATRPFSAEG